MASRESSRRKHLPTLTEKVGLGARSGDYLSARKHLVAQGCSGTRGLPLAPR